MPNHLSYLEIFAQSLRLSRVMAEALKRAGNLNKLLKQIKMANENAKTNCRIGRQCLKNLIHTPSQAGFNMEQLAALDVFLRPLNEGLHEHPLIEKSRILDWVARSRGVTCLLACKPSQHTDHISRWDFDSTLELQSSLSAMGAHFPFGNETFLVPSELPDDPIIQQKLDNYIEGERVSLISIGSPRACRTSERILATMMGVEPFKKPNPARPMPFYFVWPRCHIPVESSFMQRPEDLPDADLRARVQRQKASALQIQNEFLVVPLGEKKYTLYGILAAQRRFNGHVWLVFAGLSGPATYAAAQWAKNIPSALPARPGKNSDVLWAIVEADVVHTGTRKLGDDRIIEETRIRGEPQIWSVKA